MKIMLELNSIEEFKKILNDSPAASTSTSASIDEPLTSEAKNAGSCASLNINKGQNDLPNILFTDNSGTVSYRQLPIEHADFENINTAGQYFDKEFVENQASDFPNSSQRQVTSFMNNPDVPPSEESEVRNAGACFQLGFNPN